MTDSAYILLADGGETLFELIPLLIFVVLAAVGGLAKRAAQKRQEQQQMMERRHGRSPQGAQPARPLQSGAAQPPPVRPQRAAPAPPRQALTVQPQAAKAPAQQRGRDSSEVRRRQLLRQRQARSARRRKEPLDQAEHLHPVTSTVTPLKSGLSAAPVQVAHDEKPQKLQLSDRQALRQAIVYHEIFSLPKALRRDRESWDL